jgi:UDP-N-acetylmuramoyl-L-alanyl-D-glutamate--2,6-diaminopimelate ligase
VRLSELFRDAGLTGEVLFGADLDSGDELVTGIALDSAKVNAGYVFAALPGRNVHGAMFVSSALERGAVAVVTDARGVELMDPINVPTLVVDNPRAVVARLSTHLYGHPAGAMTMIGVTGTNGKTTVTHLVQAAFASAGKSCGIIGTLGAALPSHGELPHPRTTPESPDLQQTLQWMLRNDAQAVAMEVSSIALRESRVDGITFDVAAFTGLTQDHLDYHGTMQEYFEAKAELFTPDRARCGVVVVDDPWSRALVDRASIPLVTVSGIDRSADWFASRSDDEVFIVGPEEVRVRLPIPTDFAMTNLALSIAVSRELGLPAQACADAAVRARIPGRMEIVASIDDIDFIVDYAHTPDAIRQVVSSAAMVRRRRGGRVIVVMGAGGDRDATKRAEMGRAASSESDVLFVTDDNPRSEDPVAIRAAILQGAQGDHCSVFEVESRGEAIERSSSRSCDGRHRAHLG